LSPGAEGSTNIPSEMYIQDGDYMQDIEINDHRNRYLLTKGETQKQVNIAVILLSTDTPRDANMRSSLITQWLFPSAYQSLGPPYYSAVHS
jgi:hypothetical protein